MEQAVAKGYWIPQIDVSDPEGYKAYMAATPPAHHKYAGVALVRGGKMEVVEGRARARCVLREFPDYSAALACYRSPEYQSARLLRLPHAACDFLIAEGYDGVQPPVAASPPAAAARKGYWIGQVDVTDPEGYKPYMTADMAPFGKFGGRFLVRGGACEVTEGKARSRTVVLEFPSYETARRNSISSSSRAMTARSSNTRRPAKPGGQGTAQGRHQMAKGYWIAHVDVQNEDGYKRYAAANPAIFRKFGGRFVVRAGKFEAVEGNHRSRNVVIEFPDYASALACFRSPEYQENIKVRLPHATVDLLVIEGYDGAQP
jgi:uncharacterized protein (DUF1330 family)